MGNTYKVETSANGTTWTQLGTTQSFAMSSTLQIGLFVCCSESVLRTVVFDNTTLRFNNLSGDNQPPTIPTNLSANNIFSTNLNLNWNPPTDNMGVSSYDIYRNGSYFGYSTITNAVDLSGTWSSTFDANNLYLFIDVKDEISNVSSANWYENDGVEIYIDGTNRKETFYATTDFQFSYIRGSYIIVE